MAAIRTWRWLIVLGLAWLALPSAVRADKIPDWLPHYDMGIHIDCDTHTVRVLERITWTNPHKTPTDKLVLTVYPRFKVAKKDVVLLAKTIELLRASPSEAMDMKGERLTVHSVQLGATELPFGFRDDIKTAMEIPLPKPLRQNESITIDVAFTLELPESQGRWGHWQGITYLANWYPMVAYYDDKGWQPTPFVPWHQPFFNEAGIYSVRLKLPKDQKIACTGNIQKEVDVGDGCKEVTIIGCCARDFALVCSDRFQEIVGDAEGTKVRVLALPEHEPMARHALEVACSAIPTYNRWFGRYPYDKFDIVESHFPWNGNECSGLIMIDSRVFKIPKIAEMYIDHLISHETMHQWWYNVVGTNGYAETWMDEGVVAFFTGYFLRMKYGPNSPLMHYPRGLHWMPNIYHEDYRFNGLYGTLQRGEGTKTVQPLEDFGNVVTLFSMTYDRGARIMGMIHERVGEAAFFDFMRLVYAKYQFRILRVADFQRELEAYCGYSWEQFFQEWLYGDGMSDWAMGKVFVSPIEKSSKNWFGHGQSSGWRVESFVHQKGKLTEPTVLGVKFDDKGPYVLRVPIRPGMDVFDAELPVDAKDLKPDGTAVPNETLPVRVHVEQQPDGSFRVEMILPVQPAQISIDPDQVVLDRQPDNNHWKKEINWRCTPLYTPLEETDLTTAYDKWNVMMGPWVGVNSPWFGQRGYTGARLGFYRLQEARGGVYTVYDMEDEDVRIGADVTIDHWPIPETQFGFQFDHSITPNWADIRQDRGKLFGRYIMHYTPSFYLDPMEFVELYMRVENEYWRDHIMEKPNIERYDDLAAAGIRYYRNYLTPYWDPEGGYKLDVYYENGFKAFGADESYNRFWGEFSFVKGMPDGLGYMSKCRLALRALGAWGYPENGEHFQLGGAKYLRGMDRDQRQGNAMWIGSVEWRFPIWRELDCCVCDNVATFNHLWGVVYYDVGEMYCSGHSQGGVAHSIGTGLRMDTSIFSFIERLTLRLDIARAMNDDMPVQVWFGMQHAF